MIEVIDQMRSLSAAGNLVLSLEVVDEVTVGLQELNVGTIAVKNHPSALQFIG